MRRPTASQMHVALIVAVIIASFTAVDLRRQAALNATRAQRAALTVELAKVCRVLACDAQVAK